jgi:hypothetical protein
MPLRKGDAARATTRATANGRATKPASASTKRKGAGRNNAVSRTKRQRLGTSTPQESGTVARTHEQLVDVDTLLRYVWSLGDEPKLKETKKICKKLLEACDDIISSYDEAGARRMIGKVKVEYAHQTVESRIYPARHNWYSDLFSQCGAARRAAGGAIYVDLDIENCFPVLLEFLCDEHHLDAPRLKEYNADREALIAEAIEHYRPEPSEERPTERKAVKALFSAGYNSAGKDFVSRWRDEHSVDPDIEEHEFVTAFFKENSRVADRLIKTHYPQVLEEVKASMPHKCRPVKTALHCVLARMETECRDQMEKVAIEHHVRVDSPQHDGAYFRLDTPLEGHDWYGRHFEKMRAFDWAKLCTQMNGAIKEKYRYPVTVTVKADIQEPDGDLPISTCVFRQSDFVRNLPLPYQMGWMNRHFVMLTGRSTDGVAKLTYAPDSDKIEGHAVQAISSFRSTFAGMAVEIPEPQEEAAMDVDLELRGEEGATGEEEEEEPTDALSDTEADTNRVGPRTVDLASLWCRSMDKRAAQDIVFEPYGVGTVRVENPDYLNLFN